MHVAKVLRTVCVLVHYVRSHGVRSILRILRSQDGVLCNTTVRTMQCTTYARSQVHTLSTTWYAVYYVRTLYTYVAGQAHGVHDVLMSILRNVSNYIT